MSDGLKVRVGFVFATHGHSHCVTISVQAEEPILDSPRRGLSGRGADAPLFYDGRVKHRCVCSGILRLPMVLVFDEDDRMVTFICSGIPLSNTLAKSWADLWGKRYRTVHPFSHLVVSRFFVYS